MTVNDFMLWLGEQLKDMVQLPVDNDRRLEAGRELTWNAFQHLGSMSSDERTQMLELTTTSWQTRMIGGYRWPYDESGEEDWIAAIVGTIETHLGSVSTAR